MPSKPIRPTDAAGLVILRRTPSGKDVLLGRRRSSARFLPGIVVFPGGRLEREDHRPSGFTERFSPSPGGIDAETKRKWPGLIRCAIRETWEETGIFLGRDERGSPRSSGRPTHWQAFADLGLAPAFEQPRLLGRAITPPDSPIRFHTRFFLVETASSTHGIARDGELEQVAWVPVDEARRLDMIDVTQFMLERALTEGASDPAPLFRYLGEKSEVIEGSARRLWQAWP